MSLGQLSHFVCVFASTLDTKTVILGVNPGFSPGAAAGVVLGMVVAKTAPVGYQDEKGFHFGPADSAHAAENYAFEVPHAKAA